MKLEDYAEQVVSHLPCSKWEKRDVKDELIDHLNSMKSELVEEGYEEQEAVLLTIQRFGSAKTISRQLSESMPLIDKYIRKWLLSLFFLYVAISGYLLLFSPDRFRRRAFTVEWKQRMLEYGVPQYTHLFQNTKPFQTLVDYVFHYDNYSFGIVMYNLIGNVMLFVPLGLLLPLIFMSFQSVHRVFFLTLLASLIIETLQLLFSLGSFDVDDLLLNVLGGLLGYGMFRVGATLIHRRRNSSKFDDDLSSSSF
ncbi:VanZ family protein [Brevibacillus formosus]|uniref:Antibiotic resistance protein VanZ n=2 Tax=Brevibacillus formosus TaxID=54913 RepID=A0A837KM64_9BACL|nr:VanZ family protein [Brevibacillus formosus]KLH98081.1 antibiotic resistance protein VanZ [Brevibacillus formosus]PSJ96383.1 VanZ family protein [Brevibacillus formosus]GED59359.1 teicoplanin resistance protein VanZ [Brevibacillus formosus]